MKFIGELFKLQMLTERIMHECIKKLLSNVDNPEEEEIERGTRVFVLGGESSAPSQTDDSTIMHVLDTSKEPYLHICPC